MIQGGHLQCRKEMAGNPVVLVEEKVLKVEQLGLFEEVQLVLHLD